MDLQNFLNALEHIDSDICQVIGAMKATIIKQQRETEYKCDIKFTQQEVSLMPKTFRKEFRTNGCTAHVRKKKNSKNSYSYEIRYRKNGYNICASGATLEIAKQRFIEKLKVADKTQKLTATPTKFDEFTQHFFNNYYSEKVATSTFKNVNSIYNKWIKPILGDSEITSVTPIHCKQLLDNVKTQGYGKTADEIYSILNQVFKYAIAYNLIQRNPIAVIPHKQHERVNGTRLTIEEEQLLFDKSTPKYKCIFAVYLYCGIRPGELKTVRIEEPFLICQNTKQKGQKYTEKKIPITKNLRKYLDVEVLQKTPKIDKIRAEFNSILPNHTLKDCRRTFNSHCKECGVNEDVRKLFMGHSLGGKVAVAYTEFTDEFLLKEAEKLDY